VTPVGEFERLMDAVRSGSQDAAWELLERVGPHVLRVVRRMLSQEMRSKFDSTDFVQAVWASFFVNRQQISGFTRPEQLISFLTSMARNKVVGEFRRRVLTTKFDVNRETSLTKEGCPGLAESRGQSSPSEFAMARECWERLIDGQPEHYQRILMLKYMGESHDAIAESLGLNRKTVTRVLEKLLSKATD
jgi:RNA polymerase sigma factor (sigma-70 family)